MIECEAELRKWGNSIGLIIPKKDVSKESLLPDQKVKVIINPIKTMKVKDIFGKLKLEKSTEQILRDTDKQLDSKFLRRK